MVLAANRTSTHTRKNIACQALVNNQMAVIETETFDRKRGGCESAGQTAVHSAIGNERFDPHSMRFVPVGTGTDIHDQWHIQFCRCGHAFAHAGGDGIDAIVANFEDEFVVHLHNHACHLALWL